MTPANIPVHVAMGESVGTTWQVSGRVSVVYLSRVPCIGEWVWVVDDEMHGQVVQVDWRFNESAALNDRESVRVLLVK